MEIEQIIEVKNLTKKFKDFTAVNNISFNVKHGEVFAFLGPNGAGKTTTIKMLTTLLHPTSGYIRINGKDPVSQQNDVRNSFGICFQDQSLDDELTARENMDLHGVLYGIPRTTRRTRIEQLLKLLELWERRNDQVKKYSGGMKRRLEIGRALLHHPKVLFLDEPTQGLDPQTRNHIWTYIKDLNKEEGVTVFFTTHYMEEADRNATLMAVIDNGKIVAQGTAEELKAKTGKTLLEDAFIDLTGHGIRDEEAGAADHMRMRGRLWRRQ
jgi:ABC-2 type transport system ATP-binding protein